MGWLLLGLLFCSPASATSIAYPPMSVGGMRIGFSATEAGIGYTYSATGTWYILHSLQAESNLSGLSFQSAAYSSSLTVLRGGVYCVSLAVFQIASDVNCDYEHMLFVNGNPTDIQTVCKSPSTDDYMVGSFTRQIALVANDVLTVRSRGSCQGGYVIKQLSFCVAGGNK